MKQGQWKGQSYVLVVGMLCSTGVVLGVALLVWGLLFVYLVRLDRRIRELEKR